MTTQVSFGNEGGITPPTPGSANQPGGAEPATPQPTGSPAPEGVSVPDKFRNTDGTVNLASLLTSYAEAENRLSSAPAPATQAAPAPSGQHEPMTPQALAPFVQKIVDGGAITEAEYGQAQQQFGVDRAGLDQAIGIHVAAGRDYKAQVVGTIGSDEYETMMEWGDTALTDEQKRAFTAQVHSGDISTAQFAVENLHARYKSSMAGPTGDQFMGNRMVGADTKPFASVQEMVRAMSKKDEAGRKLYGTDPAYTEEVRLRVASSDIGTER